MRKYGRLKKKDNEEGEETPTSKNGDSNKRRITMLILY